MSAEKHTLAPWKIECGKNYSNEILGKSKTGKDWVIARTTAAKVGRRADDANARLIAAAPDLLEAAKGIINSIENGNGVVCYRALMAAIVKAEGGAE